MPSKKRKYNARFPAGRIKKIMQTDEEVGKVAQAVPIIISRTLELFVESLLSKAMQVTLARNAKTLSPSHVKQCILAESRFDFLRDLVKDIPDVSAAEEKELMSAESSPNSSRFSDVTVPPRRIGREDSNSSSSCDVRVQQVTPPHPPRDLLRRPMSIDTEIPNKIIKTETITSTMASNDTAIDLSKKTTEEKPVRTANFYNETLTDDVHHRSVITVNPTYSSPQPSTSYTKLKPIEPLHRIEIPVPKSFEIHPVMPQIPVTAMPRTPVTPTPRTPVTPTPRTPATPTPRTPVTPTPRTPATPALRIPASPTLRTPLIPMARTPATPMPRTPATPMPRTPVTPILNIDFSKNLANPEIKVLDTSVANIMGVPKTEKLRHVQRQNSKSHKSEVKKIEIKPIAPPHPVDIDHLNSGNLQIDEDYDT